MQLPLFKEAVLNILLMSCLCAMTADDSASVLEHQVFQSFVERRVNISVCAQSQLRSFGRYHPCQVAPSEFPHPLSPYIIYVIKFMWDSSFFFFFLVLCYLNCLTVKYRRFRVMPPRFVQPNLPRVLFYLICGSFGVYCVHHLFVMLYSIVFLGCFLFLLFLLSYFEKFCLPNLISLSSMIISSMFEIPVLLFRFVIEANYICLRWSVQILEYWITSIYVSGIHFFLRSITLKWVAARLVPVHW